MPTLKNGKPQLTKRQQQIYEFVKDKILNRGYGPTVREIGLRFDIASPNGVMCHLKALEKKGFITREPGMSRAIQLTSFVRQQLSLPLAGQIAAGKPLLAVEQPESIDFRGLFDDEELFCLKVRGDFDDQRYADGDCVVVRRQDECRNDDVVIARTNGRDAVMGRVRGGKTNGTLEPFDRRSKSIAMQDAEIVGVVVGMLRQL